MGDSLLVRSIDELPHRFVGGDEWINARFRLRVGRAERDIVVGNGTCEVVKTNGIVPDAEICTDPDTWLEINEGRLSGIEAFAQGKLMVRGSIQKSLMFEPLFERPRKGALSYSLEEVGTRGARISTLMAGDRSAPPLLLLHGLGATKSSWLPIVPELARRFRVIALDLPGFGASAKPRGRYDARWFSTRLFDFLDELGLERVSVAGNSMGGRIAMEMAMHRPDRIESLACLSPATAFSRRPALWLVKLLRPELAFVPSRLPRGRIKDGMKQLFAEGTRVQDEWFDAAIDDFLTTWRSPRARMAFSAAARHIYLDEPEGEKGFWMRLAQMEPPALYVYGRRDVLISPRFAERVRRAVPTARVAIWDDCGHVPQIEHPERTAALLEDFHGQS